MEEQDEKSSMEKSYSSDKQGAYVFYGAGDYMIKYGWVEIKDLVDTISGWKGEM